MSKQQAPLEALKQFLPEGTFDMVSTYLYTHRIHLTVTRERSSVLGDYRNAVHGKNHRISVNGNLNPYAFLYTLIHEIAHLLVYDQYGHKVASHGREWKHVFSLLLKEFLVEDIFPADIRGAIAASLGNPAASSCAEDGLLRVFRKYDKGKADVVFVEEIEHGGLFAIKENRIFQRGPKIRKRYKCVEVRTGREYLFSPVYEVKPVSKNS
ncbi:MAG TPA: SprT-like domain-containing protein [Chitinophagaceae bacterium]|nr:SprT-like domain-containing protein [Chitinophagaceae bacterium]